MGFLVDPIKVQVQGQSFAAVFIGWDGIDPSKLTVRQFAKELCLDPRAFVDELVQHEENEPVLKQVAPQVRPFLEQHKAQFLARVPAVRAFFGEPTEVDAEGVPVPLTVPMSTRILIELGLPFADLEIDFSKIGGVALRLSMDKAQWDQCRVAQSKLAMRNKAEVERYKNAFKALLPELQKLEQQIAAVESACEKWRKGVGKPGLTALALLAVTHEMTSVYAQQDASAARLVSQTQDLLEIVGQEVSRDSLSVIAPALQPLQQSYKDRTLAAKLLDYLEAWDPTHVYYFEAVAARGKTSDFKDFKGFDKRLFKAFGRAGDLLSQLDEQARRVANELDRAAQGAWKINVEQGGAFKSREERIKRSRTLLDELFKDAEAGWVSIFVTWSGVATTAAGNVEGPPSILATILKKFANSTVFAETIAGRDGFIRAFVLIGVDTLERDAVLTLLKKGSKESLDTARALFTNGSWRSSAVFVCYYCITAAILLKHLFDLASTDQKDGNAALVKAALPVLQDAMGVLLIGVTQYYSREMGAYLRSKGTSDLEALNREINRLESATPAAKAARVAHFGLATLTLALSIWTAVDDSVTADKFEERLLLGSVAGAALTLLGAIFTSSFLGPAGTIVGLVVVLVAIGYQKWFKPKIASAMQSVSKSLLADPFLKSRAGIKAGERTFFILFAQDVTLGELLEDTVEQLNDFPWQSKLNPNHLVDYARAGLPLSMVAQLYGVSEAAVRKQVNDARFTERQRQLAAITPDINLVRPGTLQVKLSQGEVNDIKLEVVHPDRNQLPNNIWLEVAEPDPDKLLADNGQTPPTSYLPQPAQVVMLFTHSSTRFGRVYAGSFRLNVVPDGGKVRFEVFVPVDKFATGPQPGLARASVTKELTFSVTP